MSLGRRLVGDTLVYGLALGVSRAAAFALLPLFTRVFSPAEYGAYDLVTSFSRALLVPAVLGIDVGMALLFQGLEPGRRRRAASSALAVQIAWAGCLTLGLIALAPRIAGAVFGDPARQGLIVLGALLLATQVWNNFIFNLAKWQRERGHYLLLTIGVVLLSSAASVALVVLGGLGVRGALLGTVLGGAIFVPVGIWSSWRHLASKISLSDMLRCLRLGIPFAAAGASELAFAFLLRLLVIGAGGLAAVGIFGAVNTICSGIMLISDAFASAWWPYALSAPATSRVHQDAARVMRLYAYVLVLAVALLVLFAEPLVRLLLGSGSFLPGVQLVGPFALAYWIKSVRQNGSVGLVVAGGSWLRAAVNLATVLAAVAAAYPLTGIWGGLGAAWGFAIGEATGLVLQLLLLRYYVAHVEIRATVTMALMLLLLMPIATALPTASLAITMGERLGLAVAFATSLILLGVVRWGEIAQMAALARSTVLGALGMRQT